MRKPITLEVPLALCMLGALVFAAVTSLAQDNAAPERPRKACVADTKQFCSNVKAGDGRLAQCMRDHAADLSAPCKTALQAAEAARANTAPAQTPAK